ncbi:MFS transporter, partial [Bordetella trematum]|uniref:MFS transporter n=1 Tax=Bordetella trematum TaxID=123899 RepID=UPI0014055FD2
MSVRLPAWLRNAEQPRPLLTVGAIFLGALLTTLQGRLFSAALPDLRGHFGLDVLQAAGLGTALNAAQLLAMPVVPWLATVAGPARVLLWPSLALGGLGWLIPLAQHHYPALLVMHAMAGLCLGVYLPLTISLALRSLRPQWWLLIMAAYSLRVSAGMDAGLGASALLVEEFDWRAIYWTAGVAGPLLAWLTWKALPWGEVDRQRLDQADWAGMAMFCLGLVLLFVGVEGAERLGWQ